MSMKKVIIATVVIVAAIAIVAIAKNGNQESGTQLKGKIQFSWLPTGSFAGDAVGIKKYASKHNLILEGEFGGPGINPVQLVSSGRSDFGWIAADEVFAANEKGADLVIIGLLHNKVPAGYASKVEKNIKTPKDLEGKKVGVLPFGNTTFVYEHILKKNNVNRSKISEITIGPDLKPFLNDNFDVYPIFVYDESVDLDKEGKFNIIRPEDFGVTEFKGGVYFTKRETLEKSPELVKAFIETMADGWNYAIKNPEEAIKFLDEIAPGVDVKRETEVLKRGIPYFTAYNNQPINSDYESWKKMIVALKDLKVITKDVDLTKVLQFEYINAYYK